MKKITSVITLVVLALSLIGCTEGKVEVIDFYGMNYSDAVTWAYDNEITLVPTSDYNNEVDERAIFSQSISAGTKVSKGAEIDVVYSRGLHPETEVEVPDFSTMTILEIETWLSTNNIKKYTFSETFDLNYEKDELIEVVITKATERNFIAVGDTFTFYVSKGTLAPEDTSFPGEEKWRGVNLGGWFVLEGWMTPDLFTGVNGTDETIFMQQKTNAEQIIEEHWDTFITEDDFIWLKSKGIDYVRLPIPWWLFGVEAYQGTNLEVTYKSSIFYIDRAMTWAETHDINVLLDLHTAPGGQNGFDNGGLTGVQKWGSNEEETGYIATTVEVLKDITEHYSQFDSFWGIELLNEPAWQVHTPTLHSFYIEAYTELRLINQDIWIGMHDGFKGYDVSMWTNFFNNNDFDKVFMDMHIYSVFSENISNYDVFEHLDYVTNHHGTAISNYDGVVPIIIGEWSHAMPGFATQGLNTEGKRLATIAFGNRQFNVYDTAQGWFFWNYKIDRNSHFEWDFRRLYDIGYLPLYFKADS